MEKEKGQVKKERVKAKALQGTLSGTATSNLDLVDANGDKMYNSQDLVPGFMVDDFTPTLKGFTPQRDYVMFKREHNGTKLTTGVAGILSFSEVSEIFGDTYPIIVKVSPNVDTVEVGQRVTFSAGFINEIKVAKTKVRINSLIHVVKMGGHEYYLVSVGHIVGVYK